MQTHPAGSQHQTGVHGVNGNVIDSVPMPLRNLHVRASMKVAGK